MNKQVYLERLSKCLGRLSIEEFQNVIQYYEEYFDDAGAENEQSVINELGNPEALGAKIEAEYAIKGYENEPKTVKKGISTVWIVILAIFAFPIWFPLGISIAAIAFSFVIVIFSLLFAFSIVGIALIASGLVTIVTGIMTAFVHFPTAIFFIGLGLLIMALGILVLVGAIVLIKLVFSCIVNIGRRKAVRREAHE